jgi:hypothetical protein
MLSVHHPNFVLRRQMQGLVEAPQAELDLVVDEGRNPRPAFGAEAPNIATGGAPIACFSRQLHIRRRVNGIRKERRGVRLPASHAVAKSNTPRLALDYKSNFTACAATGGSMIFSHKFPANLANFSMACI